METEQMSKYQENLHFISVLNMHFDWQLEHFLLYMAHSWSSPVCQVWDTADNVLHTQAVFLKWNIHVKDSVAAGVYIINNLPY